MSTTHSINSSQIMIGLIITLIIVLLFCMLTLFSSYRVIVSNKPPQAEIDAQKIQTLTKGLELLERTNLPPPSEINNQ